VNGTDVLKGTMVKKSAGNFFVRAYVKQEGKFPQWYESKRACHRYRTSVCMPAFTSTFSAGMPEELPVFGK